MRHFSRQWLRYSLYYEPETGYWFHNRSNKYHQKGDRADISSGRYRVVIFDGQRFASHRLAWFYMTGKWPVLTLDHADLDKQNNRWENLREASFGQNAANQKASSKNKSGHKGVTPSRNGKKWQAAIQCRGRRIRLGTFTAKSDAAQAYVAAAQKYFGKFARA